MTEHQIAVGERAALPAFPTDRSVQTRFQDDGDEGFALNFFRWGAVTEEDIPRWGDTRRDEWLRAFWKTAGNELLQGAVSSMQKKIKALDWVITGGQRRVQRFQLILNAAEGGMGWETLVSKTVEDYLTLDRGAFVEIIHETNDPTSAVVGLAHLDGLRCWPTGSIEHPVLYEDDKGDTHRLDYRQVIHMADMASPQEDMHNRGFCAVSRVLKSASILRRFSQYKDEKLSTRPLPGLVLVQGIPQKTVRAALEAADEEEISRHGRLVYRNLPILAALDTAIEASLQMVEFRSVPDGFDAVAEATLHVYLLALAFGVDAREFWPATTTGATKADALVQAQKAKGKGPGDIISQLEWAMNWKVLPPGLEFAFDFQDDEEDRERAEINEIKAKTIRTIWEPDQLTGEGIIDRAEARNLLADAGVLPEEFLEHDVTADETLTQTEKALAARAALAGPEEVNWWRREDV